jgi:hypothetical protein
LNRSFCLIENIKGRIFQKYINREEICLLNKSGLVKAYGSKCVVIPDESCDHMAGVKQIPKS